MFEAEAEGLRELMAAGAIRVPEVYGCGVRGGESFIEMERLRLGRATAETESRFGKQLAELHRHTQDQFGWTRDNTIGPTPQCNPLSNDWIAFFREHRLGFQLMLAERHGSGEETGALGSQLAEGLSLWREKS